MKIRQISLTTSSIVLTSILLSFISLWQVYDAYKKVNLTYENRQTAMNMVSDFRLQMYQLNKLLRTYIATADPKYLIYYYDLLAVQEGKKSISNTYQTSVYWDNVIANKTKHVITENNTSSSIVSKMQQQKFSDLELKEVKKIFAIANQAKLVEQIAFASTQGLYDSHNKVFIEDGKPDLGYALQLIYSDEYQKMNAQLSEAVEKLIMLTDKRTQSMVEASSNSLLKWVILSLISTSLVILTTLFTFVMVRKKFLLPIEKLTYGTHKITLGDYSYQIDPTNWLEELRQLGLTFNLMAQDIESDIENREANRIELEKAKKIAEEATKAKSIFLANMSHEIRTPMNAIIGMSYLTLKTDLTSKQREFIEHVNYAAKTLLGIINDLLDFSKIEAGKMSLELLPFNLHELLINIIKTHQFQADEKEIRLYFDTTEIAKISELYLVVGDQLRISQIINNLLSNAIKFTSEGNVDLIISTHFDEDQKMACSISVHDTGIGMSLDQQAKLFQEFVQADSATTRKFGGTGLGLALSKRLAETMGGVLSVESEEGEGSAFWLKLTLDTVLNDQTIHHIHNTTLKKNLFQGNKILLAEDNELNQIVTVELLEEVGSDVTLAKDGQQLLDFLFNHSEDYFDLILMDLKMPVLNGCEATKIIRSYPKYDRLPIIAMTAHILGDELSECLKTGMQNYISKPVVPELLFQMLNQYIGPSIKNTNDYLHEHKHYFENVNIDGVDIHKGLKHANNNPKRYLTLLRDLVTHYANDSAYLEANIQNKDNQEIGNLLHKMRGGLLGTIGAENLYQQIVKFENKLRVDDLSMEEVKLFRLEYEKLIDNIRNYLVLLEENVFKDEKVFSKESSEWINRLQIALEESSFEAVELWDEHKQSFRDLLSEESIRKISKLLSQFEFEQALTILKEVNGFAR